MLITFKKFWKDHRDWARETFGNDEVRGSIGPLKHLEKEIKEALDSPTKIEEYVDIIFLVFDAARRAGFDYKMLLGACILKLEINKKRKWGAFNPTEPVEHDRIIKD